jgi:hypothetical protein
MQTLYVESVCMAVDGNVQVLLQHHRETTHCYCVSAATTTAAAATATAGAILTGKVNEQCVCFVVL